MCMTAQYETEKADFDSAVAAAEAEADKDKPIEKSELPEAVRKQFEDMEKRAKESGVSCR